jgi:hypothetical protein
MTGILLASLCADALIGGTPGLLEGNPQLSLIPAFRDPGDPVLVLAGSLSFCSNGLASLDLTRVSLQQELEGLDYFAGR